MRSDPSGPCSALHLITVVFAVLFFPPVFHFFIFVNQREPNPAPVSFSRNVREVMTCGPAGTCTRSQHVCTVF